jgi:hypothetical protein
MLNQNSTMINKLESLNKKISYLVTLNLMGDIIYQHYRDITVTRTDSKKIMDSIRRITTATSLLNFDNIKFLMYEEDSHKVIIVNYEEISIIIGLDNTASMLDVLDILNQIAKQYQRNGNRVI